MKKKLIIAIIILIIIAFIVYQNVKKNGQEYVLADVIYGNISQEVSETGQVQMGDNIKLGFKTAGTIERIYVKIGDKVFTGSNLAKLDTVQLVIERNESQANYEIAQAKLDQLLEGATPEEIKLAETEVANAQIALYDAQQEYDENLSQAYEDAKNILDSAYLDASDTLNIVTSIRKTYFSGNDQESTIVKIKEDNIEAFVAAAEESINNDLINTAISTIKDILGDIYDNLSIIKEQTEVSNYADVVSAVDKVSLDTERSDINTALINIVNAQQVIASAELTGSAAVNTAQGKLNKVQNELSIKIAEPSTANISLYQAQVRQAQAKVDLLNNKIWDSTLRSPIQGQVVKINKELGEVWQPSFTESVVTILPSTPYEIEVDIYEEDIVKMNIGNEVSISLVAFPDQIFKEKVISIDPAEQLIEDVVYYTVTISFAEPPQGLRPGMTADVAIKTDSRENALIISEDAIYEKDDKSIVQVYQDKQIEEREITTGLMGSDGLVEVLSGLTEGEQVIIK